VIIINAVLKDYDLITDGGTGETQLIDKATGECKRTYTVTIPEGTKIITPKDQERNEERKKHCELKQRRRWVSNSLGGYFFVSTGEQFKDISPESVTRLIYLNTFIRYDSNNKLMLTERTPMQRKHLHTVLGVSEATISRFWRETCPKYICETTDGIILTNADMFIKGNLKHSKDFVFYQKFFIDGIRKLYKSVNKRHHKQLGYIFKLLPYINVEHNLICYDQLETDLDKIELISISNFCELIHYDISHLNKLIKIFNDITFDVNGKQERFCSIVYSGLNRKNAKIFINPHIFYAGTNYEHVKILGAFCRD